MTLRSILMMGAVLLLGALNLCVAASPVEGGQPIIIGQRYQIRSQVLGETRSYLVHRPSHYDISNARYPVLFVHDGEKHFQHVSALVDFLARAGKIPPMLVVGVVNSNSERDMYDMPSAPGTSGLLKFIADELIPTIDREYRTYPFRILAGWSNAGRYTLYSMVHAPEVFRGYIAIAPAFDGKREVVDAVIGRLGAAPEPRLGIDVVVAMDEANWSNLSKSWELSSHFQQRASRVGDVRFMFQRYPEESHVSVLMPSFHDGLLNIFEGWELKNSFTVYEQGGVAAIERHYAALAKRLGFPVSMPKDLLFETMLPLESQKRFVEAVDLMRRALELYPNSETGLYLASRVNMEAGDTATATELARKLLQLSPGNGGALWLLKSMNIAPGARAPEVQVSGKGLANLIGGYGTSKAVLDIELRGGRLFGRTAEHEYALEPQSGTKFSYTDNASTTNGMVTFRTDARGRVTGLVFEGGAEMAKLR